jgi:hypothetical protein
MGKNGLSYFWCGGIAVFLSWALSGCYIGNKEVDAPFYGPWYYETQLNNIQVCAGANGQAAICKNEVSTSYLPMFYIPMTSQYALNFSQISDPFIYSQLDSVTAAAVGANYGVSDSNTGELYFFVNGNGTATSPVSYGVSSQVELFHDVTNNNNPTCVMDTTVSIAGNLTNTGPYNSYTANPLSGRMVYTVNIKMTPDPVINTGCAQAVLCYNDPENQCQGVALEEVEAIYQDFVNTGALSVAPVSGVYPTINSLSYSIQYQ